ncbi:MAG: HipA N-terminal domain-containing protein [Saprospiraceae bacterium]|nr:HipA N-terminal domain-containing protein [Saprospiraceae bacterium]
MRQARILFRDEEAGILTQLDDGSFTFRYHDTWYSDPSRPAISLTLPKDRQEYHSNNLFPFFFHMLPEGSNKQMVCQKHRLDQDDAFGLLLTVAQIDPIGAVRVIQIKAS